MVLSFGGERCLSEGGKGNESEEGVFKNADGIEFR